MSLATAAGLSYKEAMLMEVSVVNEIVATRYGKKEK